MDTLNSSKDALVLIKANQLVDCNEAAIRLFGFERKKDILACFPHELLAPQQVNGITAPEKLLYVWEQVCEEGIYKDSLICRDSKGKNFIASLQVISQEMEDGGMLFYTKWRSGEEGNSHIPQLNEMLSGLAQDRQGLSLHISRKGDILYANREAWEWLGLKISNKAESFHLSDILAAVPVGAGTKNKRRLADWLNTDAEPSSVGQELVISFLHRKQHELPARVRIRQVPAGNGSTEPYWQLAITPVPLHERPEPSGESGRLELVSLVQENKSLKRLQKVLKKSLDRFRVLAEYSPDIIMQFDRSHRHLFVNRQVEKQAHFKIEEYLGKTHAEIGFPADYCTQCKEVLDIVFSTGESRRVELQLPNGLWLDWFLIPEFNSKGEVNTVISTARDISEQKKTQLKLQKSEQRLNDAFEVTKLSSWEYDVKRDVYSLSRNFKMLTGYEVDEAVGLSSREYLDRFVVKEDLGKFHFVFDTALSVCSEDFQEILDYRVRRKDGEIVHILASVRLELDEHGKIAKLYGTSQDITQLRLTEQELEEYRTSLERLVETRTLELKKSEAKLSDALRLANLGGWEYDPVIDCFVMSDEALEIIGTTAEIEGGNILSISRSKEVIHPDDYAHYREAVLQARSLADDFYTEHTEFRIVRSDGDIRFIYLSIKASKAGGRVKFYGTLQDITDIRRTEWEKNRLNAIIETTSDIVGVVQPGGSITYLNKAGKDFFGIKSDEDLQNRSFADFQSRKAERVPSRKDLYEADAQGIWSAENQYLRHDGVEVPVSQVVISHKTPDGQVECYSTIIRDISQQKRIEQDLIFKNNELDTFVYRASHDLRGPIATLMGLYNLVQYEVKDEAALRLLTMYNSQVQRLNTITLTLIELTKIKEREFKPSVIDFRKVVRSVYRQAQNMTESQDMLFESNVEEIENFVSDERLLNIILQNLVENAVKYKRQEVDSFVRVEIRKKENTGSLLIKVSDNGIGIESSIQGKIYNMFFRGNERSSGSGLGLYMLKNAVEKLGGRVALYSVLYKGTTFKIELPSLR